MKAAKEKQSPECPGCTLGTPSDKRRWFRENCPECSGTGQWRAVVAIVGWLPATINALLRMHWAKRQLVLNGDKEMVARHVQLFRVRKAAGRRRVSVAFSSPRTPADPDARLKGLLDGLVLSGAIVDDSPAYLVLGDVVNGRGEKQTIIRLEDVA